MRYRAIILDDDPFLRRLLSEVLKSKGYKVLSAEAPQLCPIYADLLGFCTHEFACGDFLLSDNRMPRMSGLDFVTRQQQRGCKGAIHNKAIFSASWSDEDIDAAEQLGCKVFQKPYDFAEIHAWLDARAAMIPPDRKLDPLNDVL